MKQSQQLLQVLENGTCSMRPTCKPNFTTVPARNMLKASTLISTYYCVDADVHNTTDMCLGAPSMTHHAEEHFGQVPCWLPTDDDQVTLWVIVLSDTFLHLACLFVPAVWKVCGNHQMVCCCLDSVLSVLDVIRSRAIGGCEQKNGAAVMQRYLVTASATCSLEVCTL